MWANPVKPRFKFADFFKEEFGWYSLYLFANLLIKKLAMYEIKTQNWPKRVRSNSIKTNPIKEFQYFDLIFTYGMV